jgi:hypothetical protein
LESAKIGNVAQTIAHQGFAVVQQRKMAIRTA